MRTAIMLLSIAMISNVHANDYSNMSPAMKAYYDCLIDGATTYAKKATNASEAIDAAHSRCYEKRIALADDILTGLVVDDAMAGRTPRSKYQSDRLVKASLQKIDDRIRPDLVRAVLEAK